MTAQSCLILSLTTGPSSPVLHTYYDLQQFRDVCMQRSLLTPLSDNPVFTRDSRSALPLSFKFIYLYLSRDEDGRLTTEPRITLL